MTYCHVLRGMSVQAADFGHGPLAVRLADAAAEAAPTDEHRMRAFMRGQQAHAYALAGNRNAALGAIRQTESALDQADSRVGAFGGFSQATLAYATAQVRYHLGDVPGSVSSLQQHFRLRDATDSRGSAVRFGGFLAERQLRLGQLDVACGTWHQVLDAYPHIQSGRADERVAAMRSLLRPHRGNRVARDVLERARGLATA